MRMALVVEYEGTGYHGFQYQPNAVSIQEELEEAINNFTGEKSRLTASGRTDAGVHAKAQVVAFNTSAPHPPENFVNGINFYLPEKIAVKSAYKMPDSFDPRRMALSRKYMYTIYNGKTPSPLLRRIAYHFQHSLNVSAMQEAAFHFVGIHDFKRFSYSSGCSENTIRQVYKATVHRKQDLVSIEVSGNAFLTHQVRRMAGALVDIGTGHMTTHNLKSMIKCIPNNLISRSLPPHGLCLMKVDYPNFPPKVVNQNGNAN